MQQVEPTATVPTGRWTQIAGTFAPASQRLHVLINGQLAATTQTIASGTVSRLCSTGTPLRIGTAEGVDGNLSGFFDGEIQDVQLYNTDISGGGGGQGGNLLGNPRFESPLGGTQTTGGLNQTLGNWLAYTQTTAGSLPTEVTAPNPVHSGKQSGQVTDGPGLGSAGFYQDIAGFDPNSTYTLSAWVYPVSGDELVEFIFGWDRGVHGNATGSATFDIAPTHTEFDAWGQSGSAPALHVQRLASSGARGTS